MGKKMTTNEIFNLMSVILSAIGLIFVIFGWIIPYKQKIAMEKKRHEENLELQKIIWEKDLIDQQISKFYGPISALLHEQDIIRSRIFLMIGRDAIFDERHQELKDLSEEDRRIWTHFIDTYKIPLNNKIIEIIRENRHLIYKSQIPTCFDKYLDYTLGWELLDNQKRNNVPNNYQYHYEYNFPYEFFVYIENTLSVLSSRKEELIGIMNQVGTAYLDKR